MAVRVGVTFVRGSAACDAAGGEPGLCAGRSPDERVTEVERCDLGLLGSSVCGRAERFDFICAELPAGGAGTERWRGAVTPAAEGGLAGGAGESAGVCVSETVAPMAVIRRSA